MRRESVMWTILDEKGVSDVDVADDRTRPDHPRGRGSVLSVSKRTPGECAGCL